MTVNAILKHKVDNKSVLASEMASRVTVSRSDIEVQSKNFISEHRNRPYMRDPSHASALLEQVLVQMTETPYH